MATMRDFASEVSLYSAQLSIERTAAVCRLREAEEAWFRRLLDLPSGADLAAATREWVERRLLSRTEPTRPLPELAAGVARVSEAQTHLANAEKWQWEIGSWATGAGEGLTSMAEVRCMQTARAWLAFATSRMQGELALALAAAVENDPGQRGQRHMESLRALRTLLGG